MVADSEARVPNDGGARAVPLRGRWCAHCTLRLCHGRKGRRRGRPWRLGIVGTPIPRPFGELLFSKGICPGRNVTKLDGTLGAKHASSLVLTIPFMQLPEYLFSKRRRWSVFGGRSMVLPGSHLLGREPGRAEAFRCAGRASGGSQVARAQPAGQHADVLWLGARALIGTGDQLLVASPLRTLYRLRDCRHPSVGGDFTATSR